MATKQQYRRKPATEIKEIPHTMFSTDETATKLHMSKRTLQRRVKEGHINPIVLGPRKHAFTESEILRFINNQTRHGGVDAAAA